MLYVILGVFVLAALGGLYMFTYVAQDRQPPKPVAVLHGLGALTGVGLLVFYIVGPGPDPISALVMFIMAALAGLSLAFRHFNGSSLPVWAATGHGLLAVSGLAFLLLHALGIISF